MHKALELRQMSAGFRSLNHPPTGIDFYSNDYLGLSKNHDFQERLHARLQNHPSSIMGSTGSRLISGNSLIKMDVEDYIASIHRAEKGLLFPTGYAANLALFSSIVRKEDIVLMDEKVHRSVYDGCRLSMGQRWKFKHNDLNHLSDLLDRAYQRKSGEIYIAIESLYSMEGDLAPIQNILALSRPYGAKLIVDEAHAIGLFGLGLTQQLGLEQQVFARMIGYGKAMGVYGASIIGSKTLIDFLVNFASPFIYSTAIPDFQALAIKESYAFVLENPDLLRNLNTLIQLFKEDNQLNFAHQLSPIQPVFFSDSHRAKHLVEKLTEHGMNTYVVFAPTVPSGKERIRITLHAFNTQQEIRQLTKIIHDVQYE